VPAHKRGFGLMFQDYALFPHRTVAENVAFGLKMQKMRDEEVETRVRKVLGLVNMTGFAGRRVTDLSGGEQQRVALARTLAPRPRLLMFDEPLGALDRALRENLLEELRTILHQAGVPAIYVTHDQEEAFALADRVVLIHEGVIVQEGTPADVHAGPASAWVARFLGLGSLAAGRAARQTGFVETRWGLLRPMCNHQHAEGESVSLLVRPNASLTGAITAENAVGGTVVDVVFYRDAFRVTLEGELYFFLPFAPEIGKPIRVNLPTGSVQCLGKL
jgi:ABC-type Fe3+/spermidine/putrescine transport system ATPase subunit